MIRVSTRLGTNSFTLTAEGHAGYAPMGQDIVCAAASALLYAFTDYLSALPGRELREVTVTEEDGSLTACMAPADETVRAAWALTRVGLARLADEYPAHITLSDATASPAITPPTAQWGAREREDK